MSYKEIFPNMSDTQIKEIEKLATEIFHSAIPALIYNALQSGKLDKYRLNDMNYVLSIIKENTDISAFNLQVTTYDTIREAMNSEIKLGREESAIILAGVCIEHLLNHFYQDLLPYKYGMSNDEVASALNSLRIPDKIGWFLKVVCNNEIPKDLKDNIILINSVRNKVVHYKAVPENLEIEGSGSYNEITKKINQLEIEQLNDITVSLEGVLNDIKKREDTNFELAYSAAKELLNKI